MIIGNFSTLVLLAIGLILSNNLSKLWGFTDVGKISDSICDISLFYSFLF